jgi:hypothetical protein
VGVEVLDGDIAQAFFEGVRLHADTARLLSDHKRFRPRDAGIRP